jgi:hypothetical protein
MSRKTGLDCSGISKPRRISAINGPTAGGGYVLRKGPKVKAAGLTDPARTVNKVWGFNGFAAWLKAGHSAI